MASADLPARKAAAPADSAGVGVRLGRGHRGRRGSPNAVRTFSIPSRESTMWLGAGKTHARQPTTLYAASQVARTRTQIVSRRRLPEIVCQCRLRGS